MHWVDRLFIGLEIGVFSVAIFVAVALPLAIRANIIVLHRKTNTLLQSWYFLACIVIWLGLGILSTSDDQSFLRVPALVRWIARLALLLWTLFGITGFREICSWMDHKSDQEDARKRAQGGASEERGEA